MKRISFIAFIFLLALTGCSTQHETDSFIVGMECGYAPYNWTEPNPTESSVAIDGGQYCDGYDVQIAQRLATSMNKELVIQKTSWEGLILSLQSGQIDAIIAGMSPTEERRKEINFSNVYYMEDATAFGLVVHKEGLYTDSRTVDDFEDARVAAQIGTFHVELLNQLNNIQAVENLKDFATMTVSLKAGELDGFVSDSSTGRKIALSNPEDLSYLKLDENNGFKVTEEMAGVAIGVAKDNLELLETINNGIAQISKDEQMSLMDKAINREATISDNFFEVVLTILKSNYPAFIRGTVTTLIISLTATVFGFLIALFVAIVRNTRITNILANIYITIFRGTPMMVQAMVIYYGTSMMFNSFRWSNLPYGNILAGILVVSINTGAYMSETIRSGIQAIDKGQFEAAKSLGFTRWQTMRYIILPQAIRNILPAIGNELIVNVKDTSVLNVISVTELFFVSNGIAATNWKIFETFTITSLIYLFLTTILTIILRFVERKGNPEPMPLMDDFATYDYDDEGTL